MIDDDDQWHDDDDDDDDDDDGVVISKLLESLQRQDSAAWAYSRALR